MARKAILFTTTLIFLASLFFTGCKECSKSGKNCLAEDSLVILDYNNNFNLEKAKKASTVKAVVENNVLNINTGIEDWASIFFVPEDKNWDLSDYEFIAADIKNTSKERIYVNMRIDNVGGDGENYSETSGLDLQPGETATFKMRISPINCKLDPPTKLIGMKENVDSANINQIIMFIARPEQNYSYQIKRIYASNKLKTLSADEFFPFVDKFGQYKHKDWLGKIHSDKELKNRTTAEEKDLAKNPGPKNFSKFGGWADGPKFKGTGFFRTLKHDGKWWLVDPEGYLFFSHGIDCIGDYETTPVLDRENYFAYLPPKDSPYADFYKIEEWATRGYYKDHVPFNSYNFCKLNLMRKYGENWTDSFNEMVHKRLRNWGMNTIANWSSKQASLLGKTPYVRIIETYAAKMIEGSHGVWGKFPDPFAPSFRQTIKDRFAKPLRAGFETEDGTINDPWCIGYFFDNELNWGNDTSLSLATLTSPADQPAKIACIKFLKGRYKTIDALNKVWGTSHASFDALQKHQSPPDVKKSKNDLQDFYSLLAEEYFKVSKEVVKQIAPNQLYLGCRFASWNDRAIIACAKYSDVVTFNLYYYTVDKFKLPKGVDMPVITGEFHFGALDRGLFNGGLKIAKSQKHRAQLYKEYLYSALDHPNFVGTHWFQYRDQAVTGRFDGENYQVGFVDICDTPYKEIVEASRQVGYNMYEYRYNK